MERPRFIDGILGSAVAALAAYSVMKFKSEATLQPAQPLYYTINEGDVIQSQIGFWREVWQRDGRPENGAAMQRIDGLLDRLNLVQCYELDNSNLQEV